MKSFFSSVLERASSSYTAWKEGDGNVPPDSPSSPGDDNAPGSPDTSGYRYRASLYVMSFSGKNKGGTPDENSTPKRRSRLELMAHPDVILAAAHSLSDAMQDILSDTANLAGDNMQGFQRLIDILESPNYSTDVDEIRASKGVLSTEILLVNMEHPLFSDMCNQISLCTNLLHAFRLLRMYEIKISSAAASSSSSTSGDAAAAAPEKKSATFTASYRLSRIFGVLIHDPTTIEKMKNSLVKLLVFPLTVLPLNGIHLQEHASYVVSQMCSACLTAEQVWYLHEVQAVTLMIRHLAQLMILFDGEGGKEGVKTDAIVRGYEGERRGMWLIGIKVIVQVIVSSVSISPKLMEDFETGGGPNLMVDFLKHTSPDNLLEALNAYSTLFFDPSKKEDDALAFPRMGSVLEDLLFARLNIAKTFHMDGLNAFLSDTCLQLVDRRADVRANEALVQNIAYLLLTMYSNCARAAVVLESSYYYTPKLLLCLPSLANEHSISAVLTLANYLCQCHDSAATVTIISLCIVTSIIINNSLAVGVSSASMQLPLGSTITACDAIVRCNPKFSIIVLRGGLLQELVCKPLSRLRDGALMRQLDAGGGGGDLEVYLKVIDLLLALSRRSSSVADEIQRSGMHELILALVSTSACEPLTARLLLVFECFARASQLHLSETLSSIISVVAKLGAAYEQLAPVLRCVTNIVRSCVDAAASWRALDGWPLVFSIVHGMAGRLDSPCALQCLSEVVALFAAFKIARRRCRGNAARGIGESHALLQELRLLNAALVEELIHAGVLASEAYTTTLDMLFSLVTCSGFDPSSMELIFLLLPHLSSDRAQEVVRRADGLCRQHPAAAQLLSEAGVLQQLIERFHDLLLQSSTRASSHAADDGSSRLSSILLGFLGDRMKEYLSLVDFKAYLHLLVNRHIHGKQGYALLSPWEAGGWPEAGRAEEASLPWDPLQLLLDIGASSSCHGVPCVTLGLAGASSSGCGSAACVTVNLSDMSGKALSLATFSSSLWLRLPTGQGTVVTLLSFATSGSALIECFLEYDDGASAVVTVVCKKQGSLALSHFKAPMSVDLSRWTSVVITYSKQKLLPFSKGKAAVYFNGIKALPLDSDNVDVEVPASNAGLVLAVGRSALDLPRSLPSLAPAYALFRPWQLGPLLLYDDVLSAQQIGLLFLRGPANVGAVVRSAPPPQAGDLAAVASRALSSCDRYPLSAVDYLEQLGYPGLLEVVEPVIDPPTAGKPRPVDLAVFASQPVLAFNAYNISLVEPAQAVSSKDSFEGLGLFGSEEEEGGSGARAASEVPPLMLLLNSVHSHSAYSRPMALVENAGPAPCVAYSLSACIAACGGPSVLLPLVQAATSAPTLHRSLQLIVESMRDSDANRRWMQDSGYKLLSYVLSIKPKHMMDAEVIKLLFDMCWSESCREGEACFLLVDPAALYYLPLNHQIWSPRRFGIASEVVRRVLLLCSDSRYGQANARRMSCLGVVRWALMLLVYGARQDDEHGSAGEWSFISVGVADMAREPELAQRDSLLSNVATLVYLLLRIDVRKRDLEFIASIATYSSSFDLTTSRAKLHSLGSAAELREELRLSRSSSRAPSIDGYSDAEPVFEGGELRGLSLLRVQMLRVMITLHEECSAGPSASLFASISRQAFTPEWFLNAIENSSDEASLSNVLRLLGLTMQQDAAFQRDFCQRDGLKFVALHVSLHAQALSMALPLVAMLLRLPMASVPYPGTVGAMASPAGCAALVRLLAEDCPGPDATEPALSEFTTPLLRVVLECLSARVKAGGESGNNSNNNAAAADDTFDPYEETVIGLFEYAFEALPSFRLLMQTRPAVELLSLCVVQCSNGHEEYGAHASGSLASAIRDEYLAPRSSQGCSDGPQVASEKVIDDDQAAVSSAAGYVALQMEGPGGVRVAALVSSSIRAGLLEHRNPCILQHYLLAFPQALAPMYIQSFQIMIMRRFNDEVVRCWPAADALAVFVSTTLLNLTAVLPLAKARVLYPCVQVEALAAALDLFARVSGPAATAKSLQIAQDKVQALVRDVGLTLRCFVSTSMGALLRQSVLSGDQRALLLARLRSLLKFLLAPQAYEDVHDSGARAPRAVSGGQAASDRAGPQALLVLDMFAISLDADKQRERHTTLLASSSENKKSSDNAATAAISAERSRLSQSFCLALSYYCLLLATEAEERVALEAGRILSVLVLMRRPIVEHVLRLANTPTPAPAAKRTGFSSMAFSAEERSLAAGAAQPLADFTEELLSRLVLQPQAEFDKYAGICLREIVPFGKDSSGNGVSFANSDEERMLGLAAWLRGSTEVYGSYLLPLEKQLRHLLPPTAQEAAYTESSRQVQAFKLHSLRSSVASSSHALASMQRAEDRVKHREATLQNVQRFCVFGLVHIASGAFQWKTLWISLSAGTLWTAAASSSGAVLWRLDQTEGPERSRRRMEQCSGGGAAAHGNTQRLTLLGSGNTHSGDAEELTSSETTKSDDDQLETLLKEIVKTGGGTARSTIDGAEDVDGLGEGLEDGLEDGLELQAAAEAAAAAGPVVHDGAYGDAGLLSASFLDDRETDSRCSSPDSASSKAGGSAGADGQETQLSSVLLEVLKGIVGTVEWPSSRVFNVDRIYGLQDHAAVLVLTTSTIHIIGNVRLRDKGRFELVAPSGEEVLTQPQHRRHSSEGSAGARLAAVWQTLLGSELDYYSTPLSKVYSVFRRRHQLKSTAVEIVDTSGFPVLFAAGRVEECHKILSALFQAELPSSFFHKTIGIKNLELLRGLANIYNRLLSLFVARLTRMWQQGELSNFEYLIHLNAAAGRSSQDLTQYPVFPWVIADYTSEYLDLSDPAVYRDLRKPMGAIGAKRCKQYGERFRTMNEFWRDGVEGSPPPFHYGTHYSCAGYVLHFLLRMQPYTGSAVALQGGHFDKPDRLFHSIESSWRSASQENLQDVRELIPEFFYLPEFLQNLNKFDFGSTQKGEVVDDVVLPPWAKGDAREFVRINRQALESRYVSENLHLWIDLIFGCKQRGAAAEDATNVFIHVTYDGEVDIDAITDPVLRGATLAQINNFGQTPSKLFNKPHPRRSVPDLGGKKGAGYVPAGAGGYATLDAPPAVSADSHALAWHQHMAPPLTSLSAGGEFVRLHKAMHSVVPFLGAIKQPAPVADVQLLSRDRVHVVPSGHAFIGAAAKAVVRFGAPSGGLSLHSRKNLLAQKSGDSDDRDCAVHECLHSRRISCIAASRCGRRMATAAEDASIRLWRLSSALPVPGLEAAGSLCGHSDSVMCLDFAAELELLVSGSADGTAALWDTHRVRLIRVLGKHDGPVLSVSISVISGYVLTLTRGELRLYSVNGDMLASAALSLTSPGANSEAHGSEGPVILTGGLRVLAVPTADWQRGLVAVTGHENGFVHMWKLRIEKGRGDKGAVTRALVPHALAKTHAADITALKLCSTVFNKPRGAVQRAFEHANCYDLFVGDADGLLTRYRAEGAEEGGGAGVAVSSAAGTIFKRMYATDTS